MSAIEGKATVNPAPLAPSKAEWVVDTEAKTSTATILGGEAVISRNEANEFACVFTLPLPEKGEPGEEGHTEAGAIIQRFRIASAESLYEAQQSAETTIRNTLAMTQREVHDEQAALEQVEAKAKAGDDPF